MLSKEEIAAEAGKYIESNHPDCLGNSPVQILMYDKLRHAWDRSAQWALSQMQPEWVACAYDTPIQNGHYMFMLDNGQVMSEVYHAVKEDKVPYLYAVAYCKIYLPQPPTK